MNGKMINFSEQDASVRGYLSLPRSGNGPGVLVIQEWWGLVNHIKKQADVFAKNGFVAFAPDLYEGVTAEEPDHAMTLMRELEMDHAARVLISASSFLKSHDLNSTGKVGCVGYCMGGGMCLYLATMNVVDAVAPYYGVLTKHEPDWSNVSCSIQGHYAENDQVTEQVPDLRKALDDQGVKNEFFIYPGAQHAFCNDDRPEVYDAESAELSMTRTVDFFKKELS